MSKDDHKDLRSTADDKLAGLPKDRLHSIPLIHRGNTNQMEDRLRQVALQDVEGLLEAQKNYGDSWCKRGGVGAFMNCSRKWDRLEQMLQNGSDFSQYDIFTAIEKEVEAKGAKGESILDAVRDLRRYLMLVEAKMATKLGDLPLQRDNIAALKSNKSPMDKIREAMTKGDKTGQTNVRGYQGEDD